MTIGEFFSVDVNAIVKVEMFDEEMGDIEEVAADDVLSKEITYVTIRKNKSGTPYLVLEVNKN